MKICEICGDEFQESNGNQKYCSVCGKNHEKTRKAYEKAQRTINRHAGVYDTPKTKNCAYCGKEFQTLFNAKFCSKKCETQYRIENAECSYCHKKLYLLGIVITNTNGGTRFCSEECKEKYKTGRKTLRQNNLPVHKCEHCGKEFYGKYHAFCSKSCYEEARKNGWKPVPQRKTTVSCKQCGNAFETSEQSPASICPACTRKNEQLREKQQKQLLEQKRRDELKKGIEKNGLCFYCQTTYFNCERMRSNFIYYPKGCKVSKGLVLEYPSYSEKSNVTRKREKRNQ